MFVERVQCFNFHETLQMFMYVFVSSARDTEASIHVDAIIFFLLLDMQKKFKKKLRKKEI